MTKVDFEKLYNVFLQTSTGKIRVAVNNKPSFYKVTSMNKLNGMIVIDTTEGYEHYKYTRVVSPEYMKGSGVEEIVSGLNDGTIM